MLCQLQEWVAGYYQRTGVWSYSVHREIFDTFTGPKIEHRQMGHKRPENKFQLGPNPGVGRHE
jgi:hypothetical protein